MNFQLPGLLREKLVGENASSSMRLVTMFAVFVVFVVWGGITFWRAWGLPPEASYVIPDIPENLTWLVGTIVLGKVVQRGVEKVGSKDVSVQRTETTTTVTPTEGGTT